MNVFKRFKEIKRKFTTVRLEVKWEDEAGYLKKLTEERAEKPSNGIFDSIFQYRAQTFNESFINKLLLQSISFVAFIYILLRGLSRRVHLKENKSAIYFHDLSIFSSFVKKNQTFGFVGNSDIKLNVEDVVWLTHMLLKTFFNFTIISAATFRIGQIRYGMTRYNCKEVWSSMEYSCTCGLVYEYCKKSNLILQNFMHGEKILTLRDTFTRFDMLHVWNAHYAEIFRSLHYTGDINIDNPWPLPEKKDPEYKSKQVCYFLKGIETKEEIEIINDSLHKIACMGYKVFYKKHPRQANSQKLHHDFEEFRHFYNNDVRTLYQFEYIISQSSTILFQCVCNGQKVIIDNLCNPESWNALISRNYYFSENSVPGVVALDSFLN